MTMLRIPNLALLIIPALFSSALVSSDLLTAVKAQEVSQADVPTETERWFGVLDASVRKFRFQCVLERGASGEWTGKLTSLDEGNRSFSLDNLERGEGKFAFDITASKAHYESEVVDDKADGNWKQSGQSFPLIFTRVSEFPEQELQHYWTGTISVLFQKINVAVRQLDTGEAFFDSVSQQAGGFVATMKREGSSVIMEVPGVRGEFRGEVNEAGTEMVGKWSQGLVSVDLKLVKSPAPTFSEAKPMDVVAPQRPQTPRPPFSYVSEEVEFENAADRVNLSGTLSLPQGNDLAAVVLISGSGPQDRDETIFDHKPFAVLADYFARNGYAVLRYDDRGVGKSTGDFASATSLDFVKDVQSAVDFLRSHPNLSPKKIILCGHSEGGIVAPMVAANDPEIAAIMLLAGPGVSGEQIVVSQTQVLLEGTGAKNADIEQQMKVQQAFIDLAKLEPMLTVEEFKTRALEKIGSILPDLDKSTAKASVDTAAPQFLNPWYRFFLVHDPADFLSKLTCPVLAICGEKDQQVLPDLNLPAIEDALATAPTKVYEVKKVAQVNHLFQTAQTGAIHEYARIEETISPDVLALLLDWLKRTVPVN